MQEEKLPNQDAESEAPQLSSEELIIRKEGTKKSEPTMSQDSPENKKQPTGDQILRSLILRGMGLKNADKISQKVDEIVELLEEER